MWLSYDDTANPSGYVCLSCRLIRTACSQKENSSDRRALLGRERAADAEDEHEAEPDLRPVQRDHRRDVRLVAVVVAVLVLVGYLATGCQDRRA